MYLICVRLMLKNGTGTLIMCYTCENLYKQYVTKVGHPIYTKNVNNLQSNLEEIMASIGGLKTTLVEGVRYRGNIGHWSWVAHRLTGLGILGFLTIHVWDTANATFWPEVYSWSIDVFKHPFFGVGEIAILGAVLYHALNGVRITLLDFKPEWWEHQDRSARIVWGLFALLFVPMAVYLFYGMGVHCIELSEAGSSCWALPQLDSYLADPGTYGHESFMGEN